MASYTKSIMASVFEDTNTHQRFGEAMSNTHQRFGEAMSKTWQIYLSWISRCGLVKASTIIHSCKHTAIRFGNVKPL